MADKPTPFADQDPWRSKRRDKLPPAGELAALLRDGHTLEDLAQLTGKATSSLRWHITRGGWSSATGEVLAYVPAVDESDTGAGGGSGGSQIP